jgi:hypothetical protein
MELPTQDSFLSRMKEIEKEIANKPSINYFFTIDPGFANMGNIFGKWLHFGDRIEVHIAEKDICTERVIEMMGANPQSITKAVTRWLHHKFPDKRKLAVATTAIENQYIPYNQVAKQTLKPQQFYVACQCTLLFTALLGCFNRWDCSYFVVHPSSVNKLFKQPKNLGYLGNKKTSIQIAHDLGVPVKTSHEAEALKNFHYLLRSNYPNIPIEYKMVDEVNFRLEDIM